MGFNGGGFNGSLWTSFLSRRQPWLPKAKKELGKGLTRSGRIRKVLVEYSDRELHERENLVAWNSLRGSERETLRV